MKRRGRLSDERGQLLIMTALFMLSLLTMTAFSFNAGYMYDKRNRLQAAADAAAMTGAIEVRRAPTISDPDLLKFAQQQVSAHNFDPTATGFVLTVNHPPASGPYAGSGFPGFVEVIASEQTETFFGNLISWAGLAPRARAVSGTGANPNCIVVLSYMKFTNPATGSTLDSTDCSITINGEGSPAPTNDLYNRANITARTIGVRHLGTQGCWSGGDCTNVVYGVAPGTDPLWDLPGLTPPASRGLPAPTCSAPYAFVAAETISTSDVNKYACGFDIKGVGTSPGTVVTFQAGLYWINGPVTASGGGTIRFSGTDVMLFYTAASSVDLSASNNVEIYLRAPTTATSTTYEGILWFHDRLTPVGTVVDLGSQNTTMYVSGALYFPTTVVRMNNGNRPPVTNDCTVIVAWAFEVDKPHMTLNNKCIDFGTSPVLTLSLAE